MLYYIKLHYTAAFWTTATRRTFAFRTKILHGRGFDSVEISCSRGEILQNRGDSTREDLRARDV